MDRADVEKIRLAIIERRNYLKDVDRQVTPSKRDLREGMMGRVRRKEDQRFGQNVKFQQEFYTKKLLDVDEYLSKLDCQTIAPMSIPGEFPVVPQPLPSFTFNKMTPQPMRAGIRHFPKGIKGRMDARR